MRVRTTVIAVAAAGGVGLAAVPAHSAADAGPGRYVAQRLIGGPSTPGMGAWGIVYNPVSSEVLVGDYLSAQVRRMTRDGEYLGDLKNPGNRIGGVASALGVDPRDGAIYLAVTGEGRSSPDVRKYDKFGNYLYGLDMPTSTTWLTVDSSGHLWVPSAYKGARLTRYRVNDATKSATAVLTINRQGTGPGQFRSLTGVGTDADDNVYVADVGNKVIHSYTATGTWRFDLGKGKFPGDIRGVAVDPETDLIHVANSGKGTLEVFDQSGAHVRTYAGEGTGDGQFVDGARQITIAPGGALYAADYGGLRVQQFTTAGSFVAIYPNPPLPMDQAGIAQARAVDVDPVTGDLLVADAWGQRIQRYAADGTLLQSYGRRGSNPPEGMNYPKGVAVDSRNRNVWVANFEGNPDLVGFTADFSSVIRRIDTPRFINDLDYHAGKLYALERRPGALHIYNANTGGKVRTWTSTKGLLRGVGVDPVTQNIWVTSDTKGEAYVLRQTGGGIIRTVSFPGVGWDVDFKGDFAYISSPTANVIHIINRTTYAKVGQIGGGGTALGKLKQPSGMAFTPSGDLYVIETANDRVTHFSSTAAPGAESVKPTVTASGAVVDGQVTVTGSAADASGIATVRVKVRDLTSRLYFHGSFNTWVTGGAWNAGIVYGPITGVDWRYVVPGTIPGRQYQVAVQSIDRRGNVSAARDFRVTVP